MRPQSRILRTPRASEAQARLGHIVAHGACESRRHLASHALGRVLRRVGADFEARYHYRPWLVESFVEPEHDAASFEAATFVCVGPTAGRGRCARRSLGNPGNPAVDTVGHAVVIMRRPVRAGVRISGPGASSGDVAERVKEATDGRVELEMYAPSQLVPFVQHLEAVRAGIIDIADVVPGYYQNEFALSHLWYYMYTDLNFFDDATVSARMWTDLYDQYMSIDFEKLSLDCPGDNGWPVVAYDLFTMDRPIAKMEDAKGLRLRSNSAGMNKIIESMGAIPVFMGGHSVADALSKGILDGVPMSDHWGTALPAWDYAKPGYWTVTGSFPQGVNCSAVSTRRNSKWMKKVSPEDQEAIGVELTEFKMDLSRQVNEARGRFLKTAAEKGITISEWPDSEKQRLVEAWKQVIDDALEFAKKEGAPAEYMLDAMRQWRKAHDGG